MKKISNKEYKLINITIASCGIIMLGCGLIINKPIKETNKKIYNVSINEKKVNEAKSNIIKLKNMESEANIPISVDIKDYLENVNNIETSVIKALKLDTSNINIKNPGTYSYTITFKNRKYTGSYIIKEKKLPNLELTLKKLSLVKGSAIPTTISYYIIEKIDDTIIKNMEIDLSKVNSSEEGIYQYSIKYNKQIYTSTIEIYKEIIESPEVNKKPEIETKPEIKPNPESKPEPTIKPTPTMPIEPTPTIPEEPTTNQTNE